MSGVCRNRGKPNPFSSTVFSFNRKRSSLTYDDKKRITMTIGSMNG
jgi:hypothetical protein